MKQNTTNNSRELIFTESKTMKDEYINEENFDIDSIVKSIISTRLFLLHIISHEEIDDIVNKAIVDAKKFDYHNITEKIYNFDF